MLAVRLAIIGEGGLPLGHLGRTILGQTRYHITIGGNSAKDRRVTSRRDVYKGLCADPL